MAPARDINGVGVGVAAAGLVIAWAGIRNVSPVAAFKDLAMGQAPTPNPRPPWQDVAMDIESLTGHDTNPLLSGPGSSVVLMAQQVARSPAGRANYCWGGGHTANPCGARCFDCSGYVSCVLNRMGLLKGSMTTLGFLAWRGATTVGWEQRMPGDIIVDARHMGIAVDNQNMINAACTACGPVRISKYVGTGHKYVARRVKAAGASSSQVPFQPGLVA